MDNKNELHPHVCILQTSFARRDDTIAYLKEKIPDIQVSFITDDTLLTDVKKAGYPDKAVVQRMTLYALAAEKMGADVILNSCSTVSEVADIYSQVISIPVVKIDEPMAQKAAELGDNIALIATVPTTLTPSTNLIIKAGLKLGKDVRVTQFLAKDAWSLLANGDAKGHNQALIKQIKILDTAGYDAIITAQVSMRALIPELNKEQLRTPVLYSFYSGLDRVVEILNEQKKN